MIKTLNVVGARPNFMKMAPIHRLMMEGNAFSPFLVHTGQHYDESMSEVFFRDLGLPRPDASLNIGSGTHGEQTARAVMELEPLISAKHPDVVIVVGDVNSTLAGAVAAAKLNVPVAHVEAGLRSFDRTMPEEVNRVVADVLSDVLFAPSEDAVENLKKEGISSDKIHFVGNVMIDSLQASLERAEASTVLNEFSVEPGSFFLATLHRPSNVDDPDTLLRLAEILAEVGKLAPMLLAAHPRTSERLSGTKALDLLRGSGVRITPPLGYLDFLKLMASASAVLTDSGGIQEETTVLGVPCLTLRETTERPITVTHGTNRVTGLDREAVLSGIHAALNSRVKPRRPPLWDGRTAERIVDILISTFGKS